MYFHATIIIIIINIIETKLEGEEDTLPTTVTTDPEQGVISNKPKKDDCKRRPSLAQKMTSNLRRFSGAQNTEHKIDISEPSPKFGHKKIKVSGKVRNVSFSFSQLNSKNKKMIYVETETQHSWHDGRGKCNSTTSGNTSS